MPRSNNALQRTAKSLDRMVTITDQACEHLRASYVVLGGMAWILIIGWDKERWDLGVADCVDLDQIPSGATQLAPGVFLRLSPEDAPPFPGAVIDLENGHLAVKLHAV